MSSRSSFLAEPLQARTMVYTLVEICRVLVFSGKPREVFVIQLPEPRGRSDGRRKSRKTLKNIFNYTFSLVHNRKGLRALFPVCNKTTSCMPFHSEHDQKCFSYVSVEKLKPFCCFLCDLRALSAFKRQAQMSRKQKHYRQGYRNGFTSPDPHKDFSHCEGSILKKWNILPTQAYKNSTVASVQCNGTGSADDDCHLDLSRSQWFPSLEKPYLESETNQSPSSIFVSPSTRKNLFDEYSRQLENETRHQEENFIAKVGIDSFPTTEFKKLMSFLNNSKVTKRKNTRHSNLSG